MDNRPLLRSRLVAALVKRTLLASSSASLRSSAVRSGARLNINGLVYHRRKAVGRMVAASKGAVDPRVSTYGGLVSDRSSETRPAHSPCRAPPRLLRRYLLVLCLLPHVSMAHHLPVRLLE